MPGDVLAAEFYDQRPTADVVRIPPTDPGPDQWKPDHRRPWVPMMRSPVVASTVPGLKAVLQGWPRRTNLTSWRDTLPGRYRATVYGDEIKDNVADLPEPFDEALPRFLTEFGFGDFYTRTRLTLAERELLMLCALATIGDTSPQLGPTAVRASRWATPRLPSSQHWCTAPLHRVPARRRCHTRGQEPLAPTQQYCLSICLTTWPQISPHRWTVLDNPEAQPIDHAPAKPT